MFKIVTFFDLKHIYIIVVVYLDWKILNYSASLEARKRTKLELCFIIFGNNGINKNEILVCMTLNRKIYNIIATFRRKKHKNSAFLLRICPERISYVNKELYYLFYCKG